MELKVHPVVWRWYGLAVLVLLLDQASKIWVSGHFLYGQPWVITSFFNFTLLHNTGAAFSFLSDAGGWQRWFFGVVAIVVSAVLVVWLARLKNSNVLESLALALVLGGALGNLYDRLMLGYVVDFIVLHYESYYWPAFNLADSAIVLGAGILLVTGFKSSDKNSPDSNA